MSVALYMDVHMPQAVTDQLRRRGVDVLTAIEDQRSQQPDDQLLQRAAQLSRVLMTFDVRFKALAENWQRVGRSFSGLAYAYPQRASIGQLVKDLELIAKATDPVDWQNVVAHLPL